MPIRLHLSSILLLFAAVSLHAQSVGINTDSPDASAALDIVSLDKGVLIPRTDTSDINAAGSPATGLLIFQDSDNLFYYYDGTKWVSLAGTGSSSGSDNRINDQEYYW